MKTKKEIEKELVKLFKEAKKSKVILAVASDEEGNGYSLIGTSSVKDMSESLFGGTKPNAIVIAVDGYIEDEEIFEPEEDDIDECEEYDI